MASVHSVNSTSCAQRGTAYVGLIDQTEHQYFSVYDCCFLVEAEYFAKQREWSQFCINFGKSDGSLENGRGM